MLAIGIAIEILTTAERKLWHGLTKLGFAGLTLICFGLVLYVMSRVVGTMPLGIAYSIWAGVGIVGVMLIGAVVFGPTRDGFACLGVGLILAGVSVPNAMSSAASG